MYFLQNVTLVVLENISNHNNDRMMILYYWQHQKDVDMDSDGKIVLGGVVYTVCSIGNATSDAIFFLYYFYIQVVSIISRTLLTLVNQVYLKWLKEKVITIPNTLYQITM